MVYKSKMPFARDGRNLVWFENRIWAIGGYNISDRVANVDSYDPTTKFMEKRNSV